MKNALLCLVLCVCLSVFTHESVFAQEADEQVSRLNAAFALDAHGQLWRVTTKEGWVWIDSSPDWGKSFSNAIKVNTAPQTRLAQDTRTKVAINSQNQVFIAWSQTVTETDSGYLWFSRSLDGGKSFSAPSIIYQNHAHNSPLLEALNVTSTGTIYLAWREATNPDTAHAAGAIYYAISDDSGSQFSPAQKLSADSCNITLATQSDGLAVALWLQAYTPDTYDYTIAKFSGLTQAETHRASFNHWAISLCPTDTPAIARGVQQNQAWGWHMAWSGRLGKTGLFYARMDDEAWVSSRPVRLSQAQALSPSLISIEHESNEQVWLAWKEHNNESSIIQLALSNDGGRSWDATHTVASNKGRSNDAQLLQWQRQVYLVWNTEQGLVVQKLGTDTQSPQ